MQIVTASEFRANQKKYFDLADKETILVARKNERPIRISVVNEDDFITNKLDLIERIRMALQEVKLLKEGKLKEPSMSELLDEL